MTSSTKKWIPNRAKWARTKAEELEGQARELELDRSGDWKARERREAGARRLRQQASRYRSIASRVPLGWDPRSPF